MGLAVCSPVNKPPSMKKISRKVKVPILSIEVDHLPSALRKTPPLLGDEAWVARLVYDGGRGLWNLGMEWRDRVVKSRNISQRRPGKRQKVEDMRRNVKRKKAAYSRQSLESLILLESFQDGPTDDCRPAA